MAGDKSNWRKRLKAVNELKKWDCQQSRDVLTRLAIHDLVFAVKEAAFRAAQAMGIEKNGQKIWLGKKPKGNLIKDINKMLYKVQDKMEASEEFNIEEFKAKFKQLYPEAFDVYQYERRDKFDTWIQNVLKSKPKKRRSLE